MIRRLSVNKFNLRDQQLFTKLLVLEVLERLETKVDVVLSLDFNYVIVKFLKFILCLLTNMKQIIISFLSSVIINFFISSLSISKYCTEMGGNKSRENGEISF